MAPELTENTPFSELIASRFVSDGKRIVYSPFYGKGDDVGLSHQMTAEKYHLNEGYIDGKPIIKAGGWIELIPVGGKGRITFVNDTTSCEVKGTLEEQEEALKEIHKLAKKILGEDKVIDLP